MRESTLKKCRFEGSCGRDAVYGDFCRAHYEQKRKTGRMWVIGERRGKIPSACTFSDCNLVHFQDGYCEEHYKQYLANNGMWSFKKQAKRYCKFEQCDRWRFCKGYCRPHYTQLVNDQKLTHIAGKDPECSFERCPRPHFAKGYCRGHYGQLKRGEAFRPLEMILPEQECKRKHCRAVRYRDGRCYNHYKAFRSSIDDRRTKRAKRSCTIEDCDTDSYAKGLCPRHYRSEYGKRLTQQRRKDTMIYRRSPWQWPVGTQAAIPITYSREHETTYYQIIIERTS